MGRVISGVCDFVCVSVCVCRALKGKRLELSTPNSVDIGLQCETQTLTFDPMRAMVITHTYAKGHQRSLGLP